MKPIILDRDGVINEDSDNFIRSVADWIPIEGSLEAIARLTRAGFDVFVFTNQSGVARGLFDLNTLNAIHARMIADIEAAGGRLRGVYVCPHGPDDSCSCRKPLPGLLLQIEHDFSIDWAGVPVVGDSRRDLDAGIAMGARPILVETGKGRRTLRDGLPRPAEVYPDLAHVVHQLLA